MIVRRISLSFCLVVALGATTAAMPVSAGVPDVALSGQPSARAQIVSNQVPDANFSFYIPEAGSVAFPLQGADAARFFRACPNNDFGSSSLPNNARLKIVVRDSGGRGISGIAAADICVLFNGGTAAQGYSGSGADSIIANSQWNQVPLCPDVRCLAADGPTDAAGMTYITFTGSGGTRGVGVRDPSRKWGHYDSEPPVYVLGVQLSGRLDSFSPHGTYTLRIKNMDWTGGLGTAMNQGELVSISDYNGIAYSIGQHNTMSYWKDLDSSGSVNINDMSIVTAHLNHNCSAPSNP